MEKLKKMKWKKVYHGHEGIFENKVIFSIEGNLCVTDLRFVGYDQNGKWKSPENYRIKNLDDGKQIASDLLNNLNLEVHHLNRDKWIQEGEKTALLIKEAEELLSRIKNNQ